MQELRLVLIIVGGLAIAALLFHGLWTSKKEGKIKFGDKPLNKLSDQDEVETSSPDGFDVIRKEPKFAVTPDTSVDPLFSDVHSANGPNDEQDDEIPSMFASTDESELVDIPSPQFEESVVIAQTPSAEDDAEQNTAHSDSVSIDEPAIELPEEHDSDIVASKAGASREIETEDKADELEVLVLHVHTSNNEPFVGTQLFESMSQNGLVYGEMDIFHRHTDMSGTGKVLFSVANMMQPGTLAHDDPADFSTKGISFFMTLPCFGNAEQNFKLMLRIAQQIADDMGGNVLDEKRNMLTPNRIDAYKKQTQEHEKNQAN